MILITAPIAAVILGVVCSKLKKKKDGMSLLMLSYHKVLYHGNQNFTSQVVEHRMGSQ